MFEEACIFKAKVVTMLPQAQDKFEEWHAEKWLSPRRVLQKAGAQMRPVLLPFWLFEAAIKVEYTAQVLQVYPERQQVSLPETIGHHAKSISTQHALSQLLAPHSADLRC